MSYPYDINPWDDNYNINSSQSQQAASNYGSSGNYAMDAYSNPMAAPQYSAQGAGGYGANYQNPDPYRNDQSGNQQDSEQEQQPSADSVPPPPESSLIGKFLRQHIPICIPILDTISGINLPFIDALLQNINKDLLVSKMFYFFFYSAFGSLFPLMGVYFKQLGMNPFQVGILTGVRPFIEIFSAPFWHSLAERFHKSKALLLFSLLSWIIFTYSLAHIRPPASNCVAFNDTNYVLYTPYSTNDLSNYEMDQADSLGDSSTQSTTNEVYLDRASTVNSAESEARRERRRKRRQATINSELVVNLNEDKYELKNQHSYGSDSVYESPLDLDIDMENDFEDRRLYDDSLESVQDRAWSAQGGKRATKHSNLVESSSLRRYKREYRENEDYNSESKSSELEDEEPQPKSDDRNGNSDQNEESVDYENENEIKKGHSNEKTSEPELVKGAHTSSPPIEHRPQQDLTTITTTSSEETPVNKTKRVFKQRHKTPPTHIVGMSPITVEYAINYNKEKHGQFVTPMFSTIVYKLDDIKEVFFLLLLLISLGEFFSAPALTLADSATLSYLGDNTDLYGRQRMFGSLSWAITLLFVGMALDNATSIADHPCGPHQRERSYTVCFMIFSLLMACALLTATQFRFDYPKGDHNKNQALLASATSEDGKVIHTTVDGSTVGGNIDQLYASTQPRSIFNTAPPVNAPVDAQQNGKDKFEFIDKWKSAVFAQRTWELPEWVNVFRQFANNSLHLTYLFITWFLGCGVGLVFTFLFWHLQDIGGTPTLFGICSVINHISEILAYFFSFTFIKRFGHTKVLSVGLGCNVIRFLYVAFLTDPYYALPFELVQGITHAACFAACCSYISHVSKPELRTSTQGVMQGLHHGIGRACGTLLGGYLINIIGSRASFCIYGLLSGCVLAGFLYVRKKASEIEAEFKVDENEALGGYGAPQGVPSAIPGKMATSQTNASAPQNIDYQW